MGFFSSVKYSTVEHYLTEHDVKRVITYIKIPTLASHPERDRLIQDAILGRRRGDGKISLQQIYDVLTSLKNANQITKYDRAEVMKEMKLFYEQKDA
ncbi:MAG: hypothetical protein Q7K39_02155 [Candidatus Magasanikbacteria bacterium]|nr:hypothetical protein [Candidatus Magasanikbacteria bacterium]